MRLEGEAISGVLAMKVCTPLYAAHVLMLHESALYDARIVYFAESLPCADAELGAATPSCNRQRTEAGDALLWANE